jgi:hypothetical protein
MRERAAKKRGWEGENDGEEGCENERDGSAEMREWEWENEGGEGENAGKWRAKMRATRNAKKRESLARK